MALLAALFPEGGTEPFVASAFWPALAAIVLVAIVLPSRERTLRLGAAMDALACAATLAVATPLGGNVTRLGALVAGPVLLGALLGDRAASGKRRGSPQDRAADPAQPVRPGVGHARRARPALLGVLVPALAYWTAAGAPASAADPVP